MFTVNTRSILPHRILQPFIRYFAIRSFDTQGIEIAKPMIADHEMTMVFFLHSRLFRFDSIDNNVVPYVIKNKGESACCYTGLQTSSKGFVVFKGATTILNIHFKPVGFFNIFDISPRELVDLMGDSENILSNEINFLKEEMYDATTIGEALRVLENYLIKKLLYKKPKYKHQGIRGASNFLLEQKGLYSIRSIASQCNMTIQTFEVQFTEQVGLNPKYFSRLLRFGLAVELRLYQPLKSWTEIAYLCGYFDQTHLIKEFKEFSNLTPNRFFQMMNPIAEVFED